MQHVETGRESALFHSVRCEDANAVGVLNRNWMGVIGVVSCAGADCSRALADLRRPYFE